MLWTIAILLVLLWALGYASGFLLNGFIHILLFLALAAVLIRVIRGRPAI